jgi:cell division protein FtsW
LFGVEVKGSKRWMDFPLLPRFQPVELVKPLFIVFVAKIIVLNEKTNIYRRYLYSFLILLVIVIFLINQPDLGQTLLFASAWVTMIFVSGFNMFFLLILSLVFLGTIALLIFFFP